MATTIMPDNLEACHRGLRMTADAYFRLPENGGWYELVDGVVCMSPSPTPLHQKIATWIAIEIGMYLRRHPIGEVLMEVDVHVGKGPNGGDLVYRPDVVYLSKEKATRCSQRITEPPELVVEVISADSRQFDTQTKKVDYERCGVQEYWIVDPLSATMTFFRREGGRFVEFVPSGEIISSHAVPGLQVDLRGLREMFDSL